MRSFIIILALVLSSGGCATQANIQYAEVALSLGVTTEEVAGVARSASIKHKRDIAWVRKTDGGIEVGLADKPNRPHGITVVFRKVDGQWHEDPNLQDHWIV